MNLSQLADDVSWICIFTVWLLLSFTVGATTTLSHLFQNSLTASATTTITRATWLWCIAYQPACFWKVKVNGFTMNSKRTVDSTVVWTKKYTPWTLKYLLSPKSCALGITVASEEYNFYLRWWVFVLRNKSVDNILEDFVSQSNIGFTSLNKKTKSFLSIRSPTTFFHTKPSSSMKSAWAPRVWDQQNEDGGGLDAFDK